MNKFLLALVMLLRPLYERAGVNTAQLKAILRVRLMMDDRKPLSMSGKKKKKPARFSSVMVVFISLMSGLAYVIPLVAFQNSLLALTGYFTMFSVFLSLMLITDFVTVLMDTRDKTILFPRPVSDRTLLFSRLLHIFVYFFRIVLPMAIPGWILATVLWGWKAFFFMPLAVLLMMTIVLFLVMGIYLLMLRMMRPQRFREVLNYFQIVFSVFIFGFYYLVPQMINASAIKRLELVDVSWIRVLPAYWIASIWNWLHPAADALPFTNLLGVLALLFPFVCLAVTIKFLAPSFITHLSKLSDGSEEAGTVKKVEYLTDRIPLYKKLSRFLNDKPAAQAGFNFAWLQTGRSRMFKMRVYPSFGYVPIYFLYFFLSSSQSFAGQWQSMDQSARHIGLLYMSGFVMLQCINYLTFSDQYKASWVYFQSRTPRAGTLLGGAFKAVYIKYFLPFFLAISLFVFIYWGARALADILLALLNLTFFTLVLQLISYRYLPFSRMEQIKGGGRMLLTFASLAVAGGMGFGHYLAYKTLWLMGLFIVLSGILVWMVWDSYIKTTWKQVRSDE